MLTAGYDFFYYLLITSGILLCDSPSQVNLVHIDEMFLPQGP